MSAFNSNRRSLVAQGVDGVEQGRFAGRVEAEANSDGGGDTE